MSDFNGFCLYVGKRNPIMDYKHYTVEDFAFDGSFQKWVLEQDSASKTFWEAFYREYPRKQQQIQEARNLLLNLKFNEFEPPKSSYYRIRNAIHEATYEQKHGLKKENVRKNFWYGIAATVTLVILSFFLFFNNSQNIKKITYSTGYGEIRSFELPDGSKVTLNANSNLTYFKNEEGEQGRTAKLNGEAFFEVLSLKQQNATREKIPFVVHSGGVNLEVWGTSFNINERNDVTSVVLEEGRVRVFQDNQPSAKGLVMNPGEMVEVNDQTDQMTRKSVKAEHYTSWRNKLLAFENSSLQKVAESIETYYGWQVAFKDQSLKSLQFSAKVPIGEMDDLLILLQETFDLKFQKHEKKRKIIFMRRNPDKGA